MRGMLVGGVERLNSRREVRGFMLKLWTGTLPVPTQLHYRAGATSKWPLGQDGKAICPLCGEQEGNTTHAMALCGVEQMQTARDAAVTELDGLLEVRGIRHQRWQTGDLMGSQAERLNSTTTISLGGSFPRTWLAWWETLRLGGSGELDEGNRRSARVADPRVRQAPMGDLVAHLDGGFAQRMGAGTCLDPVGSGGSGSGRSGRLLSVFLLAGAGGSLAFRPTQRPLLHRYGGADGTMQSGVGLCPRG